MTEYPSEFEFDVLLKDGAVIQLRPIRPDDAERERAFFTRVGRESAYFRFFRNKPELTPEELRYFTNVDYDERMAFGISNTMAPAGASPAIPTDQSTR